jgi:hypothetical protein
MSVADQILNQSSKKREDKKYQFKIDDTPDYRLDKDVTTISASELSSFKEEPREAKDLSEAMAYAFKIGVTDTYRGVKQIIGYDKEQMKKDQKELHRLMEKHGGFVKGAYFFGALIDPATWLIPFAKAKTIYQMGKYGMVSGAVAGAAGYVDEDSFLNTRTKQAGAGAIGGGIVAPGFGLLKNLGVKITGKGQKIPLTERVHKMNFTADDAEKLKLNKIYLEGRQTSPGIKELTEEGFKGRKVIQKAEPKRIQYIRPTKDTPYTKPDVEVMPKSLGISRTQFLSKLDKDSKVKFDPTKKDDQLVRDIETLNNLSAYHKNTKGGLLNGPRYFFNKYVATPYREKFGNKLWKKISTTGEGGLSFAGGAIGFAGSYDQPTVPSIDAPFSNKLGRAFLGALSGYLTGKYVLKTKMSTLRGFYRSTTAPVKSKIGPEDEAFEIDDTLGEFLGRGFLDLFTRDYKLIKQKSVGLSNSIVNQYDSVLKNLDRLSAGESAVVTSLLAGDISKAVVRNKNLVKISEDARDAIQRGMQELVDYGYLRKSTFDRNVNSYLGRMFLDNDRIDFRQIADALRPRGQIIQVTPKDYIKFYRLQKPYEEDGRTIKKVLGGTKENPELIPHRGWELPPGVTIKDLQSKKGIELLKKKGVIDNDGLISIRWDMTKTERMAKEEIEDASLLINQTMRIQSTAIGNAAFYNDIARRYAIDKKGKLYRNLSESQMAEKHNLYMIPKTKIGEGETSIFRYGNLAGRYVDKEIFTNVLQRQKYMELRHGAFFRSFRSLNRLWKASKTAWNPTVHVNNIVGNFIFTDLADVEFKYLPYSAKILWNHSRNPNYQSEIVHLARQHGVFDAGFVDKELKNISQDAWSKIYKYNSSKNEWENSVSVSGRLFSAVRKNFITNNAEDLYRLEDHVFRLNAFIDRLRKGHSADEAALFARKQFVDYDIQAPVINAMRHTVTPFLAFTYRVVPILAETAVLRPWKFAKYGALGYALNKAGEMFGGGDPDKERSMMEGDKYLGGKVFNLGIMPYKNIKIPFQTEDGQSRYVFIERYFPGGDVFEMGSGNVGFLPAPLQISGGIAGDVLTSLIGFDLFLGKKIPGRGLSGGEDLQSIIGSIASKLIPNFPFVPGSFSTKRIDRATRGGEESLFSEKESELVAIANSVGIKVNNQSVKKLNRKLQTRVQERVNYYRSLVQKLYKQLQTGEISKAKYDRKRAKIVRKIEKVMEDYNIRIDGYEPKMIKEPDFILKMLGNNAELDYKTGGEYEVDLR